MVSPKLWGKALSAGFSLHEQKYMEAVWLRVVRESFDWIFRSSAWEKLKGVVRCHKTPGNRKTVPAFRPSNDRNTGSAIVLQPELPTSFPRQCQNIYTCRLLS